MIHKNKDSSVLSSFKTSHKHTITSDFKNNKLVTNFSSEVDVDKNNVENNEQKLALKLNLKGVDEY